MSAHSTPDARFRGCFTAITTPFTPDGESIDMDRLDQQIARQAQGGVTGIVVSGTTGESPTLDESEYESLLARAIATGHRHNLMVLAGTGSNSTRHAVHLQQLAHQLGADAALSVNPYYNKPTQEGLFRHFTAIADSCPLPTMLYNIPGRTAGGLTLDTIQKLARHPNIRALKDAAGSLDLTSDTCASCPGLAVLSGDDPLTLPMISVGALGVVSVVSNIAPGLVSSLCREALAGNFAEARTLHREASILAKAMFLETNPIPVKAALRLLGLDSGTVRLPLTQASVGTVERLRQALTNQELLQMASRAHAVA